MALPTFSTRQLFVSVTVIGVGFGAIALSLRPDDLSSGTSGDERFLRTAARVIGWSIVCLGVIPLIAARPMLRALGIALWAGALPGLIFGLISMPSGPNTGGWLSGYARRG